MIKMNIVKLYPQAANRGFEAYGKYGAILAHIDLCTKSGKWESWDYGNYASSFSI